MILDAWQRLGSELPPTGLGWSVPRKQEYFDWDKSVVDRVPGTNARLDGGFDQLYVKRP